MNSSIADPAAALTRLEQRLARLEARLTAPFDLSRLMEPGARGDNLEDIRARTRAVGVGEGQVLCQTLGRYKTYVSGADVTLGCHLIVDGYWEIWITEFVARHVCRGMRTLDLGANLGYFTLLMADLVGPTGEVVAFEPAPFSLDLLSRNVRVNGFAERVQIYDEAIWRVTGDTVWLTANPNEPSGAAIGSDSTHSGQLVRTRALGDIAGRFDFAKVDIEGVEEEFWQGRGDFFDRNPDLLMIMEFNPVRCRDPHLLLDQIEARFGLRYVGEDGVATPMESQALLSQARDWMLVLGARGSV